MNLEIVKTEGRIKDFDGGRGKVKGDFVGLGKDSEKNRSSVGVKSRDGGREGSRNLASNYKTGV